MAYLTSMKTAISIQLKDPSIQQTSALLRLPDEVRSMVLDKLLIVPYILFSAANRGALHQKDAKPCVQVLRTCKQLYLESKPILYRKNLFSFACTWDVPSLLLTNKFPTDNLLFSVALKGIRKFGLIIVMYMENMYYRAKTFMKPLLRWKEYDFIAIEKLWIRFEGYEKWVRADNPLEEGPCDFVALITEAPIRVKNVWICGIQDEDIVRGITDVFEGKRKTLSQHSTQEFPTREFRVPWENIQDGALMVDR